jgi:hypothetical protein
VKVKPLTARKLCARPGRIEVVPRASEDLLDWATLSSPGCNGEKRQTRARPSFSMPRAANCGTSGCAPRIREGSIPGARVFMMWESEALRLPSEDHFVWTETARRMGTMPMEPHEYREAFLRANPSFTWTRSRWLQAVVKA